MPWQDHFPGLEEFYEIRDGKAVKVYRWVAGRERDGRPIYFQVTEPGMKRLRRAWADEDRQRRRKSQVG